MQCVHSRRIHTSVETQRPRLHAPYQSLQAPTQTSFATPSAARRCTSSTRRSLASFLFGSAAPCSFVSKPSTSSTTRISMHPPEPRPGRSQAPAAVQRPSVPLPLGSLFHFEHVSCLPGLHQAQLLASEMKSFHRPAYERSFSFIHAANGVSPVSDARVVLQKLRPPAVLALLAAPLLLRAEGQPLLHFVLIKCNLFPHLNPLRCPPNE